MATVVCAVVRRDQTWRNIGTNRFVQEPINILQPMQQIYWMKLIRFNTLMSLAVTAVLTAVIIPMETMMTTKRVTAVTVVAWD